MAKRKDSNEWLWELIFTLAGIFGLLWLLNKILSQPKGSIGIGGLKYKRNLYPYIDRNGSEQFRNDLEGLERNEITTVLQMVVKARQSEILSMPFFKTLKGTPITAELRQDHFRVMLYRVSADDYLMLSVFKKKTNETPKNEITKAENRLAEYLSRKK